MKEGERETLVYKKPGCNNALLRGVLGKPLVRRTVHSRGNLLISSCWYVSLLNRVKS